MCVVGDLTQYTKFWRKTDVMKVLGKFSFLKIKQNMKP